MGSLAAVLTGTGHPVVAQGNDQLTRLDQVPGAIARCMRAPEGLKLLEHMSITARFSLKKDGTLVGPPRITFVTLPPDTRARQLLTEATLDAFARCTPVNMSPSLGAAAAGKPFNVLFFYKGQKGREI
jgi:hypothetical protein